MLVSGHAARSRVETSQAGTRFLPWPDRPTAPFGGTGPRAFGGTDEPALSEAQPSRMGRSLADPSVITGHA
jgi:hypothetical protein